MTCFGFFFCQIVLIKISRKYQQIVIHETKRERLYEKKNIHIICFNHFGCHFWLLFSAYFVKTQRIVHANLLDQPAENQKENRWMKTFVLFMYSYLVPIWLVILYCTCFMYSAIWLSGITFLFSSLLNGFKTFHCYYFGCIMYDLFYHSNGPIFIYYHLFSFIQTV